MRADVYRSGKKKKRKRDLFIRLSVVLFVGCGGCAWRLTNDGRPWPVFGEVDVISVPHGNARNERAVERGKCERF